MASFNCKNCGIEVKIKSSHLRFRTHCSRKCGSANPIMITCLSCKKEIKKYNNGKRNEFYCSSKCLGKAKSLRAKTNASCIKCNKDFTFPKWMNKKYCSSKCRMTKSETRYCEICSNEIIISPTGSDAYYRRRRFCSMKCTAIYNSQPKKGIAIFGRRENNINWKGGKGTERHSLMRQQEYILWRTAIFIRDDYTCQICFIKGIKMHADHINPWALYPELRYAIDNGRTLCFKCHYKVTFNKKIPDNIKSWG